MRLYTFSDVSKKYLQSPQPLSLSIKPCEQLLTLIFLKLCKKNISTAHSSLKAIFSHF